MTTRSTEAKKSKKSKHGDDEEASASDAWIFASFLAVQWVSNSTPMRLGGSPVRTHRGITNSMYTMYTKTVQSFESELVPQVAGFVQQDDEKKKKKKDHLKINRRDTFGLL